MSEIMLLTALTVVILFLTLFLKNSSVPIFGVIISCSGGILILIKVFPYFSDLIAEIRKFSQMTGVKTEYWGLLLKVILITYLGDFAAQLCSDAGENGLAQKLELGIKVLVMVMALPLWKEILQTVIEVFG